MITLKTVCGALSCFFGGVVFIWGIQEVRSAAAGVVDDSDLVVLYDAESIWQFSPRKDIPFEEISRGVHEAIHAVTVYEFDRESPNITITEWGILSSTESVTEESRAEDRPAFRVVEGDVTLTRQSRMFVCCHAECDLFGDVWFLVDLFLMHPTEREGLELRVVRSRVEWKAWLLEEPTSAHELMGIVHFDHPPTDDEILSFATTRHIWHPRRLAELGFAQFLYSETWKRLLDREMPLELFFRSSTEVSTRTE